MYLRKSLCIVFFIILIFQPIMVNAIEVENDRINGSRLTDKSLPIIDDEISTDGYGGEEYLKDNIYQDGSFAEKKANGAPKYGDYALSATLLASSTDQVDIFGGSYSGSIRNLGSSQYSSFGALSPNMSSLLGSPYIKDGLLLSFRYMCKDNPDIDREGYIETEISIFTGTTLRNLHYVFSDETLASNSTNNKYYDMRGDLSSWHLFSRNITKDYVNNFGAVTSSVMIFNINFRTRSPIDPTGFCTLVIDNVSLLNRTADEYIVNGDFEAGDDTGWLPYSRGPGSATITNSDSTDGSTALQLTANTFGDGSSSYAYYWQNLDLTAYSSIPKSYIANQPNEVIIDFNWKYRDILNGGEYQDAYFYLNGKNDTFSYTSRFYLGVHNDTQVLSNSTSSSSIARYYTAEGFGIRDSWTNFHLDFYDIVNEENMFNVSITRVGFYAKAGYNANASVDLLIDDMNVICDPIGDSSFEYNFWEPADPIFAFYGSGHADHNITTDSHSGDLAINVSSYDNHGSSQIYRSFYLPVKDNLYTDFWWKLNKITSHPGTYCNIEFWFNDSSYNINYVLGGSSSNIENSTFEIWYFVDGYNTTGTWMNLVRDLMEDIRDAWGDINLVLTDIVLHSFSEKIGGRISIIYDDFHFVRDTTAPNIDSVVIPNTPTYYRETIIDVSTTDVLNEITDVVIHYHNDSMWQTTTAEHYNGDTYRANIPMQNYGIICNYYVEVLDSKGNSAIDDNEGANYTFTVIDDIDPIMSVFGPDEGSEISGQVIFHIYATDIGSGIDRLNISYGETEIYNNNLIPDEIIIDTTTLANGEITLEFIVVDYDGNHISILKTYTIKNTALTGSILEDLFNWGTLIGAGLAILVFGIVVLVLYLVKKKTSTS